MKRTIFTAVLAAAVLAGTASAELKTGDPRVCSMGPARKADCAEAATEWTLRVAMSKRLGYSSPRWSSVIDCTSVQTNLLKWRCSYGLGQSGGTAVVTFRALSKGWTRTVTAVKCNDPAMTNPPRCS